MRGPHPAWPKGFHQATPDLREGIVDPVRHVPQRGIQAMLNEQCLQGHLRAFLNGRARKRGLPTEAGYGIRQVREVAELHHHRRDASHPVVVRGFQRRQDLRPGQLRGHLGQDAPLLEEPGIIEGARLHRGAHLLSRHEVRQRRGQGIHEGPATGLSRHASALGGRLYGDRRAFRRGSREGDGNRYIELTHGDPC